MSTWRGTHVTKTWVISKTGGRHEDSVCCSVFFTGLRFHRAGAGMMVLKKINDRWWMLASDDGVVRLTWFGQTKEEVMGRFKRYIRELDLDKVRYRPRGAR